MSKRLKFKKHLQLIVGLMIFVVVLTVVGLFLFLTKSNGGQKGADVVAGGHGKIEASPATGPHQVGEEFDVVIKVSEDDGLKFSGATANVTLENLTAVSVTINAGFQYWAPAPGHMTSECPVGDSGPDCRPSINSFLGFAFAYPGAGNFPNSSYNVYTIKVKGNAAGTGKINITDGSMVRDVNGSSVSILGSMVGGVYTISPPALNVTGITSTNNCTNGFCNAGKEINFNVTYGGNVTVVGTPYLAMNNNGKANYGSSSGNTVAFKYIVQTSDQNKVLALTSTSAITLPSGSSIKDQYGQNTNNILSSATIPGNPITIDTILPTVSFLQTHKDIYFGLDYSQEATVSETNVLTSTWSSIIPAGSSFIPLLITGSTSLDPLHHKTFVKANEKGTAMLRLSVTDRAGNNTSYPNDTLTINIFQPGNINKTGAVDFLDFSALLSSWGTLTNVMADLNLDQKVDFMDFSILLSNWGK